MVQGTKTVKARRNVAQTRQSSGPIVERRAGARSVGTFVPRITKAAFEKFGFSTAQLLTDWPQIAGPTLARITCPERIVWPRRPEGVAGEGTRRAPPASATLHLMVDPAHALEVQYGQALLIDRINAYFGYRAVGALRLRQTLRPIGRAPVADSPARAKPSGAPAEPLERISDPGLQAALERMQAGLTSRR